MGNQTVEKRLKVLLIEDDAIDQKAFERHIRSEKLPYDYKIAGTIAQAKQILAENNFDVVISDFQLSDGTGMEILDIHIDAPIIITTGTGSEEIAVKAMRAGAYDYLIKDPDRYYLKVLSIAIEKTLERREAQELIKMLSHAMMGIRDSVLIEDKNANVIFVNQALLDTYGFAKEDVLGKPSTAYWSLAASSGAPAGNEGEFLHLRKDGSSFPVLLSRSMLKDDKGVAIAFVTISIDITERKQAEQAMLRRTEELARSKTELEQLELFAFITTHDLQEPLHKIKTIASQLKKHAGALLDETSRGYLARIEEAVNRFGDRLDRTRDFARIMKEGQAFEVFDMSEMLRGIVEATRRRFQESQGEIRLEGDFPKVEGDRLQLDQLFMNLLNNALKFHRKDTPPRVVIRSLPAPSGYLSVAIEDNGIGFDEKYLERLFRPFERIHDSTEYEGTGMGLAICKKILLRHDGKIDVKSTVGSGTTFTLTLPLLQEKGRVK